MALPSSVAEIAQVETLAQKIWEQQFAEPKNLAWDLMELGANIQRYATNLRKLGHVITDVTKLVPDSLLRKGHTWDLNSLFEICGDFRKPLDRCKQIHKIPITDILGFGFELEILTNQVILYNIKVRAYLWTLLFKPVPNVPQINIILKPLELKLLFDLKKDIYNVHGNVSSKMAGTHEILNRIEKNEAEIGGSEDVLLAPPQVPNYLERIFEANIERTNLELKDGSSFPLARAIDAFHHHFEQSTSEFPSGSIDGFLTEQTPRQAQYLNLMKSVWILQKIKQSDAYARSISDKLWECYVKVLDAKCKHELCRFTTQEPAITPFNEPDKKTLDALPEVESGIGLRDEVGGFDFQLGPDYSNAILRIKGINRKDELVLLRRGDIMLEMHRLSITTGYPHRKTLVTYINLQRALFVPLYASPESAPDALRILFKSDKSLRSAMSLSFLRLKDLLDFQHVITGYMVVYVKLQRPNLPAEPWKYRESTTTGSTGSSVVPSLNLSSTTYQTSSTDAENTTASKIEVPSPPVLVLFLSSNSEDMSFLAIEMDQNTLIGNHDCACSRDRINCIHSLIKRSGGLIARRVEADRDGSHMNLASLGVYQKLERPVLIKRMKCLQLKFGTPDERIKFEEIFRVTKSIWRRKVVEPRQEEPRQEELRQKELRQEDSRQVINGRLSQSFAGMDAGMDANFSSVTKDGVGVPSNFFEDNSNWDPVSGPLSSKPLRFDYNGILFWEGLETYEKCDGVIGDILTVSRFNGPKSHCYLAKSVSEILHEHYPAFGLEILNWITRVCQQCQKLENNTILHDSDRLSSHISQTQSNRINQKLTEPEIGSPLISTGKIHPIIEVIESGATHTIIKGHLEFGLLRWALSTTSEQLALEIKSTLSWTLAALRCQPRDAEGLYSCTPVSLDTGLPEIRRFEPTRIESYCWTNLFSYACVATLPSWHSSKEGLEIGFSLLLQLAAVDQEIMTEDGSVLFGFDTALIPLSPPESRRWHFLVTKGRQITPARVKREFGRRNEKLEGGNVRFQGEIAPDYRKGNVYVGWCTSPVVEIGTINSDTTPVDDISMSSGLRCVGELEEIAERSSGNDVSFFSRISFFGAGFGASGGKKREKKFKQVSVVAKHTQEGNFEGILTSARATPSILWDQSVERAWLVSAISALLLASMRYVKWKKYSFKSKPVNGQFGPDTIYAAPEFSNTTSGPESALRQLQMLLVDEADGVIVNDIILFENIIKRMWFEMSIGDDLCCSSTTGKKYEIKESIMGYDLSEAICGTRKHLRSLRASPCIKSWQPLAHVREAQIIFCRDIGTIIRCNSPMEPLDCCTRNFPKGALSCLIQDLRTFYGECWDKPLNLPAPPPNTGALSIGDEYQWIPRGCKPVDRKEVECCSRSLQSIASRKQNSGKLRRKNLQTTESQIEYSEVVPWTFAALVTFGSG